MVVNEWTVNNKTNLTKEVAWASQNMPRTLRQVAALPDLSEGCKNHITRTAR
jgi:hypothetical protein